MIDTDDLYRRLANVRESQATGRAVSRMWTLLRPVTPERTWIAAASKLAAILDALDASERRICADLSLAEAVVRAGSWSRSN